MQELEELVLQAQLGDKQAYDALYNRFRDMALSYSLSIVGDYDLAEDARQEAFINAYCDILSLRDPKAFPAWFKKIVYHSAIQVGRRRHRLFVPLDETVPIISGELSASEQIGNQERQAQVNKAIKRLPEIECEAVRLFYFESRSLAEISQALGLPTNTVKSKLHMARAKLRQTLVGRAKESIANKPLAEKKKLLEPASREAVDQIEKELHTMLSMSDAEGQHKIADMVCAQVRLQRFLGETDAALVALRRGMALPFVKTNTSIRARLRAEAGLTYIQISDYTRAKQELRQSRSLMSGVDSDQATLASVLNGLGICSWGEGAYRKAREYYAESLRIGKDRASEIMTAETYNNLALLDWKEGRLKDALRNFEACLRRWKKVKCPFGTALTQMNLGIIEENLGHYFKAESHYQAALDAAEKYDFVQVSAATRSNFANLALQQSHWKEAQEHSLAACELAKKIRDRRSEAIALENLALACLGRCDHAQCTQTLHRARKIAQGIGDKERLFSLELVEIEMRLKPPLTANMLTTFAVLQKKLGALGYHGELPRLLGLRGRAEHLAGAMPKAKRTFAQALALGQKQGNRAAMQKIRLLMDLCKQDSGAKSGSQGENKQ
jgi:RNA polymerase sigma factor (sigma-70 family)